MENNLRETRTHRDPSDGDFRLEEAQNRIRELEATVESLRNELEASRDRQGDRCTVDVSWLAMA